jgi:putative SOS response-associated peptidase YedK
VDEKKSHVSHARERPSPEKKMFTRVGHRRSAVLEVSFQIWTRVLEQIRARIQWISTGTPNADEKVWYLFVNAECP